MALGDNAELAQAYADIDSWRDSYIIASKERRRLREERDALVEAIPIVTDGRFDAASAVAHAKQHILNQAEEDTWHT